MTRFLSDSLQAPEPAFRLNLRQLEAAHGNPNADIRLTTEVLQATRAKMAELGLDAYDTTPHELYLALEQRVKADDARLVKTLRTLAATHISAEADVVAGMRHALQQTGLPDSCFALKTSKLKAIFKKITPKKAMKQLGYRSLDSMLKHEPPALVITAAYITESPAWRQQFHEHYKRLQSGDFESRQVTILHPDSKRWQSLARTTVEQTKHNVIYFKELGTLILLPLPAELPAGAVTASLVLALHALNDIHASSTFLKLCQVRPDFGGVVQSIVSGEPTLKASLLDQAVPWHLVQRSFGRLGQALHQELFETHMQAGDLSWHPIEAVLERIEPSLSFWRGSDCAGLLHDDRRPVSLNIIDAALNLCNQLPFERRLTHYFQQSLWHELLLRYLKPQTVERAVLSELQPQLAPAYAVI
jgi:hypothetical protein